MSSSVLSAGDKPVTFISVSNRARAKVFYAEKLGLEVLYEDDYALVLNLDFTTLRISEVSEFQPQQFTVLGWEVADIFLAAKKLKSLNIVPTRYDALEQDEYGIWRSPSTSVSIVWFEDSDGNLLSLSTQPTEVD